jgi:hypothetical protein
MAAYTGSTMNGSITWAIAMLTPAVVPSSRVGPSPTAASSPLTTPVSCSSTTHAKVRAISDVQNGSSTSAVSTARHRGPTMVIR